ncbi:MAG: thioredoxin domain-containing protein, partial [Vicinamibacterales bacterium]
HFEKMLYDQAQLALAYLEASQAVGSAGDAGAAGFFAAVAEDTLAYVARDMRDSAGGFFSAEDADSRPPGPDASAAKREGAFYVWTNEEIGSLLGADADVVRRRFGIEPDGNAPHDPQAEFAGQNLLYTAASIDDVAEATGRPPAEILAALGRARDVLFEARRSRPRPHLDDKIVTSWNGLMIAAFARAARVLPDQPTAGRWLEIARGAADFIRSRLWSRDRGLLRRYRGGDASIDAYAEDYACLIWGAIELFQCDGDPAWLEWARALQAQQDDRFWDSREGGWFSTTGTDPSVLLRMKEDYDGAEPSASAVSVMNLLWLSHLVDDNGARTKIEKTLGRYGTRAGRAARAIPMMLAGLSAWHAGISQVVVVGDRDGARTLLGAIAERYLPFAIVIPVEPGERQSRLGASVPVLGSMAQRDGRATAFVCRDFACRAPVVDPAALLTELA